MIAPDNSRIVDDVNRMADAGLPLYGSYRGKPVAAVLALNPNGYGPPALVPCPCAACRVLAAREDSK